MRDRSAYMDAWKGPQVSRSVGWPGSLGTKSPTMPRLSSQLRPSGCMGDLRYKESDGGGMFPTALPASPLTLAWHQGNWGKAALCAWYGDAADALLTAELVASPELSWGLLPDVEMGGGFRFTICVPG